MSEFFQLLLYIALNWFNNNNI